MTRHRRLHKWMPSAALGAVLTACTGTLSASGLHFPPPGEGLDKQAQREPAAVALKGDVVEQLKGTASRWALWRHGYLVHVEGDFNAETEVKSLRKTWHALTVGAAIKQGKIPSYDQKLSVWNPELKGKDADATWWHVITQSSGFDYPYDDYPAHKPGEMWTYSDKNPKQLCHALARVYGKQDYHDGYEDVVKQAYFDAIGMRGWRTSTRPDGIRFHFDLEDMGRLGLLVLARGKWKDEEIIPQWFVEELETKQTHEMLVNYNGPDDGRVGLDPEEFPECPYGFMTWVNSDGDRYPGADRAWANGAGAGGTYVLWNHKNGIVFAGVGVDTGPTGRGIPHIIETNITGSSPLVAAANPAADAGRDLGDIGRFAKWARIEIAMPGPDSVGTSTPNPFATLVDVTFRGPGGRSYTVPGFYDGDGRGGLDGNVWRVRFAADATGTWRFTSKSANSELDGYTGSFTIIDPDPAWRTPDFYRWGRLEYTGTPENGIRYLKFRDGPYWLKAGCDDPENFLGAYQSYDTHAERAAAIEYLAERGVNCFYMMTHNLDGDDRDVWPWLGKTAAEAKANGGADARFDVARLAEWVDLFEHMQRQGVVCYIVLEDDSAWTGYDYRRYYRELIARFGHLPALVFNFCEEHNERHSLTEALGYMKLLEEIDPYDHPRGIHNVNSPSAEYVDAEQVDFTSIQTSGGDPLKHNKLAIDWLNLCRTRGRRSLVVNFDEGRPEQDRRAWWSAYMAGGVWEAHVLQPYDRPMSAWEPVWTELGGARVFMAAQRFSEMEPSNELVTEGTGFCLAKPGAAYALYLPEGGSVTIDLAEGVTYEYAWWNPANGRDGSFQDGGTVSGGRQRFSAPGEGDWALRIMKR